MPHINIKAYAGRTEEQKKKLAEKIKQDVVEIYGCSEGAVSVLIEDMTADEFKKAYEQDTKGREDLLLIKPSK